MLGWITVTLYCLILFNVVRTVLKLHRNVLVRSSLKHLHWLSVSERIKLLC